ncbi:MAG: DNRLRE domain-containing protein [Candidatus Izemoplasmatales bacterium]
MKQPIIIDHHSIGPAGIYFNVKLRKIVIIIMTVLMLVTSALPAKQVRAYAVDEPLSEEITEQEQEEKQIKYKTTTDPDFDISEVEIVAEVIDQRTTDTKTFLKADGSYVAVLYGDVVHYLDNGKYVDIDNSLVYNESSQSYSTKANSFKVEFPETAEKDKSVRLFQGDYLISWSLDACDNARIAYSESTEKPRDPKTLTKTAQAVQYERVMDGVSVEYVITGSQLKENIILDRYVKDFSLSFDYSMTNLSLVKSEDGSFVFVNKEQEEVFRFSSLYMYDQSGEESTTVELNVEQSKDGTYTVTIIPDSEWLSTAVYPVVIDPTISSVYQSFSIQDTYISKSSPDSNYGSSSYFYASYNLSTSLERRGLISFVMPDLSGKQITYANLSLFKYNTTAATRTIALHHNTSKFSENVVTWNTWMEPEPSYRLEMVDYVRVNRVTSEPYIFNITKSVREWVGGVSPNYGFTIKDKEGVGEYTRFYSSEASNKNPVIEIGYIDPQGIKDYWTYSSQSAGNAGIGYVSDLTGSLTWIRNDLTFQTEKQSLNLSMIHSVYQRTTDIGYGAGWQTSYSMVAGYDPSVNRHFVVDATGSKVYYQDFPGDICDTKSDILSNYVLSGCTGIYLKAEDGSGRILLKVVNVSSSVIGYYLLTPDLTLYWFDYESGNIWHLSGVGEWIGVDWLETTIMRDPTNPSKITEIQDDTGNKITLSYSSGRLEYAKLYVKNPSGGYSVNPLEQTKYSYTFNSNLFKHTLSSVCHQMNYNFDSSYSASEYSYYSFDFGGRLTSAYEAATQTGLGVSYIYTLPANKIIRTKTWIQSSGNVFSSNKHSYGDKQTTITDQNGHFVTMKFDDYGHTVNTLDYLGNSRSFAYCDLFKLVGDDGSTYTYLDGDPDYDMNHKLAYQSGIEVTNVNPLVNSGFEFDLSGDFDGWNYFKYPYASTSTASRTTTQKRVGLYSMKIATATDSIGIISQSVVLKAGTYTLSGYVKNATSGSEPTGVYISVSGASYSSGFQSVGNSGEWVLREVYFVVENDETSVTVRLVNASSGSAYFDGIQINKGFSTKRQNAIENSSFEYVDGTTLPGWTFSSSNVSRAENNYEDDDFEDILGTYGITILGSGNDPRYALTEVSKYLDLSHEGALTIGGWGKSEGTPISFSSDLGVRYFRIRVKFLDATDTVIDTHYISFDTSVSGWQYAHKEFEIPAGSAKIYLYLEYKGEGSVSFDGITATYESTFTYYLYDDYGRVDKITSQNGDITQYAYPDNYSQIPSSITHNDVTTTISSENERLEAITIYNNVSVTPTYNDYGQVTSLEVGNGSTYYTTSTTYLHYSQYVSSTTDEYGNITAYTTDVLTGLLQAITNAKNGYSSMVYDDEVKLVEVDSGVDLGESSEESLAHVAYLYDSKDRLSKICLEYENPSSPTYYYEIEYDAFNRIVQVYVNSTTLMSYTYVEGEGYLTAKIGKQEYGNQDYIEFTYDDNDQISEIQMFDSSAISLVTYGYEYDQKGALSVYSETRSGVLTAREFYAYDSAGRMTQIKDESGNITNFGYDPQGNIVNLKFLFEDFDSEITYEYDGFSMISNTEYITSNGVSVNKAFQYEENALHRLQYIKLTIDSLDIKQSFTYSGAHSRIQDLSFDFADNGTVEYKHSYIYDELGNIVQESYYERVSSVLTLKRKVYYEYDGLNQLVAEDIWVSSGTSYTNVYEYDSRGNRTANYRYQYEYRKTGALIPPSAIINFGLTEVIPFYDSNIIYSQVKNVDVGGSSELTFTYQDSGSPGVFYGIPTTQLGGEVDSFQKGYYEVIYRATSSYFGIDVVFNVRFSVGNLATSAGTSTNYSTYVYDDEWLDQLESYATIVNGVSTNHVLTYDNQGNPTQITNVKYNGTNYTNAYLDWDGRRLSNIVFATGSTLSKKIGYQYNDQGYRISKTFYNYGGSQTWLQQNRITYELLGDKVVYETNGTYAMVFNYDYDGTLIGFTLDLDISDGFDGYDFFYIRNQQGDITMIVDNEGTVNAQYQYDAYGKLTVAYESTGGIMSMLNPYYYRGYRYDWEIERYYLNSRYYDPAIGRFISSDGLLGQAGNILSTNMYAYCTNNPVMYLDPSGECATIVIAVIAILLFTPVGGTIAQIATSAVSYVAMAVWALGDLAFNGGSGAWADMNGIGWNPFNTDESAVFASSYFSFYKCQPVFMKESGRSGSFYFISLNRYALFDTLRHERGHGYQSMMMGIATYAITVGLPSWRKWGLCANRDTYNDAPWETMADLLGGVQERVHTQQEISRAWIYYGMSHLIFPSLFFW